jgi:hypothetical protein
MFLATILIVFNILFPHEVFAMDPDNLVRSFNPDTYIRHELDGTPVQDTYNKHTLKHSQINIKPDLQAKQVTCDNYGKIDPIESD